MSKPINDTYEKHTNEARVKAHGYSIIPEFNISEHITYYLDHNGGNFLADNPYMFTLPGGQLTSSFEDDFAKIYSNSDFLKDFSRIREEHEDEAKPTRIDLKASVIMKFVPRVGFYPVERTVQLAEIFSQSYGDSLILTGTEPNYRTAITPLFGPGILYNSIKSGVGVSYPVFTSSDGYSKSGDLPPYFTRPYILLTAGQERADRIPFEALLEPNSYIKFPVHDLEPHPSASLDSICYYASDDFKYTFAMSNFLAAVPDFFLKSTTMTSLVSEDDNNPAFFEMELKREYRMRLLLRSSKFYDEYTIFKKAMIDGDAEAAAMLLELNDPNILNRANLGFVGSGSKKYSEPTFSMYERPHWDYSANEDIVEYDVFAGSGIYQRKNSYEHGGSAFGPPTFTNYIWQVVGGAGDTDLRLLPYGALSYDAYTPPYYHGFALVDFIFKPFDDNGVIYKDGLEHGSRRFTLSEIFSQVTSSYYRYGTDPIPEYLRKQAPDFFQYAPGASFYTGSNSYNTVYMTKHSMDIDSSVTLFSSIKNKSVEYKESGEVSIIKDDTAAGDRWAIQTKWETPIFNYTSSCEADLPASGSQNIGRGVWHNFGEDLAQNQGLFLQVVDYPAEFIDLPADPATTQITIEQVNTNFTSSLIDVVGFQRKTSKVGVIAEKQTITEAIVAIPFIDKGDERDFFKLDKDLVELALAKDSNVGASIKKTINSMKKYVIPPKFDFITFDGKNGSKEVEPIVMYFLEFNYEFDRDDIKNVWHNISPKAQVIEASTSIGHELIDNELLSEMDDKIRWMVFKVKQKGAWNYYDKTVDASDDQRYKYKFDINSVAKEPEYSYNWPYDFMSVIEYGKLDVSVTMETEQESKKRTSGFISTKTFEKDIIEQIDIREQIKNSEKILGGLPSGRGVFVRGSNTKTFTLKKGGDVQTNIDRSQNQTVRDDIESPQEQKSGSTNKIVKLPDSF
jgi:hypothetical protein